MKKKNSNAKKTIANNFDFRETLKDKKIFEIYKDFYTEFKKLNISNNIAIAVSGGADSLALCFLISCFKSKNNKKIQLKFYLVDHGLRNNSNNEALLVKKQLKLKNIDLKILKWKGKKPIANLQSVARQKRYDLLFKECKKSNIATLLTAHHEDDFYETFFSRLLRGSGTEGLSSFAQVEKKFIYQDYKISLLRPLIKFSKQDLIYIANKVFKFYTNDPSNEMEKFQRVRLRKLILNLKNEGLDFQKLKLTVHNLASTNTTINKIVDRSIYENVTFSKNKYLINYNFFSQPDEIVFRSLSILIKKINKNYYPPRGKKLINLISRIKSEKQVKATLGGTIIQKVHNSVIVSKEKTKKR